MVVKKVKKRIVINISNCKYELLETITGSLSFKSIRDIESPAPWDIFWIDTGVSLDRVLEMKEYQKINHFPGMHEICRKDHLARNSSRLIRLFPREYDFFPKSWILPNDLADFKRFVKRKKSSQSFLRKPEHGCQGKGIFLFKDPETLVDQDLNGMVIQSYIKSPCLLDGLKFDFRVYVLVTSVNPLRLFVYKDGLARFATEKYESPNPRNFTQMCMHLTNYAINKGSSEFVIDDIKGSKRTIQNVLHELESKNNISASKIWSRIHDVIVKTVLLVQPGLAKVCKPWFPENDSLPLNGSQCFEILGFDILLDSKFKPWVLEVNHSPSFACDSALDKIMKTGVIEGAFKLLHLSKTNSKKLRSEEKEKSQKRLFKSSTIYLDRTEITPLESSNNKEDKTFLNSQSGTFCQKYYLKYDCGALEKLRIWEDARMGNYERAFPPKDPALLENYLRLQEAVSLENAETNSMKVRKAYLESKNQLEKEKNTRIEQWKVQQRNRLMKRESLVLRQGSEKTLNQASNSSIFSDAGSWVKKKKNLKEKKLFPVISILFPFPSTPK